MITWNYRVFCEENGDFIIREVFYGEEGEILGCTENAVEPWGRSQDELARELEAFKEALSLPVLKLDDIPVCEPKRERDRASNLSHEQVLIELGLNETSTAT
jgi:hypothetical protein